MVLYDDDDERPAKGKYYLKPQFLKGIGKYSNLYQNETYACKKTFKKFPLNLLKQWSVASKTKNNFVVLAQTGSCGLTTGWTATV